ncbi:unnamed protein product [Orchesella dallaii]|uniref:Senescence domain-containing protein n=1 Tax=Orchesella dallaii TaxID=48710 RepID=A0ABP1QF04_9HEXA
MSRVTDQQIFATLNDAEKTVKMLRDLIEKSGNGKNTIQESQQADSRNDPPSIQSNQELYSKYMSLSTVKFFESQGVEVFRIPDSVGLYFIVPNTRVRTSARSSVLRIVRLNDEDIVESKPPAFLQVGDWVYPLMPGSMVYRSEHKYYLFPDLMASTPGSSVGVVLPQSCSPQLREQFETIILSSIGLSEFPDQPPISFGKSTELILGAKTSVGLIRTNSGVYSARISRLPQVQTHPQPFRGDEGFGKKIGTGIKAGGQLISRGFEMSAIGTANAMSLGSNCIKSAIGREERNHEIHPLVENGVVCAKDLSGKLVDISSSILSSLAAMTSNLASLTACYIKTSSGNLLNELIERSGISQRTIDIITSEVKDIGDGIVSGSAEAYAGLENAATIMATALNSNTVDVVSYWYNDVMQIHTTNFFGFIENLNFFTYFVTSYGPAAARVLQSAGEVVGNVTLTGINVGHCKPTEIAGTTVKKTGLALALEDCSGRAK